MSACSVGFVGAGRVARILVGGWAKAGTLPVGIVASDIDPAAGELLRSVCGDVNVVAEVSAAVHQDLVFLAVHPPAIKDVAPAIRDALASDAILVSLAPKFTIAKLSEMLGGFSRIARVIPNAPSLVGRGFNPVAFAASLPADARQQVERLLAPLGAYLGFPRTNWRSMPYWRRWDPRTSGRNCTGTEKLGEAFGLDGRQALEALDKMLWGRRDDARLRSVGGRGGGPHSRQADAGGSGHAGCGVSRQARRTARELRP
ncbi:NAD(P)-binding domain-containing protein [bacterium]|nr:NAD(P)-binding domain-containing protein [bacterium]